MDDPDEAAAAAGAAGSSDVDIMVLDPNVSGGCEMVGSPVEDSSVSESSPSGIGGAEAMVEVSSKGRVCEGYEYRRVLEVVVLGPVVEPAAPVSWSLCWSWSSSSGTSGNMSESQNAASC